MVKVIAGALAAALAMFFLSYLFYASPLHRVAYGSLEDNQAAVLQQSFAANLPRTATYNVPDASTPTQTVAYGAGPIPPSTSTAAASRSAMSGRSRPGCFSISSRPC